ncbi:hypothetical protein [Pseudoruegeria sp. SHC-113]|uniref:hypothetical protein n=1 Tax=Pseudoruegeria sp. SHC-113 TaxID=2855439 RepID=UPI0021BA5523|nr:hypothetical protein [Pseudoruegeria sp. SHC-113]MCT8161319.1 hypothetical protein [Pseudoruegeria sp. SHC-113]
MRRAAVGAMLVALFAAPAFAITLSDIDTDGDSLVSYAEITVNYPDLTEEVFTEIDASGDGFADEAELTAAVEAGLIEDMAD